MFTRELFRINTEASRVGNRGEDGLVEISDLMITGSGPTAGAVFWSGTFTNGMGNKVVSACGTPYFVLEVAM